MKNRFAESIQKSEVKKTIRMGLVPTKETQKHLESDSVISAAKKQLEMVEPVKRFITEFHKAFIADVLRGLTLDGVEDYVKAVTEGDRKAAREAAKKMRAQMAAAFSHDDRFSKLDKKELITELLPEMFKNDKRTLDEISAFKSATTTFTDFNKKKMFIYGAGEKVGTVPYRTINENLPIFVENIRKYEDMRQFSVVDKVDHRLFSAGYFSNVLTQEEIDAYNYHIGCYNKEINLYNQKNNEKLPYFKKIYKQILTDSEPLFETRKFEDDVDLKATMLKVVETSNSALGEAAKLISSVVQRDYRISASQIRSLSNKAFGDWKHIDEAISKNYDENNLAKKKTTAYNNKKKKALKGKTIYTRSELESILGEDISKVDEYLFKMNPFKGCDSEDVESLLGSFDMENDTFMNNAEAKRIFKAYLDSIVQAKWFIAIFATDDPKDAEEEALVELFEKMAEATKIHSAVKNYCTRRYVKKDINIDFDTTTKFLEGWSDTKICENRGIILRDKEKWYLAILTGKTTKMSKIMKDVLSETADDSLQRMSYMQMGGAANDIFRLPFNKPARKFIDPSEDIVRIRETKSLNTNRRDLESYIDFIRKVTEVYPVWQRYNFRFKDACEYTDSAEFIDDMDRQGYTVEFVNTSKDVIKAYEQSGDLYLFEFNRKDFRKGAKGKKDLHTIYFEQLFSPENLKEKVYRLNGGANIMFREKALKKTTVHKAGQPIKNKNPLNVKKTSTYHYDIVKDRRFTRDHFELHMTIAINQSEERRENINVSVREEIQKRIPHIVAINRGERNLLYMMVVDPEGNIVKEESLNIIATHSNGKTVRTDYGTLLAEREDLRASQKDAWDAQTQIRDLKDGYLSVAVKKVLDTALEYEAVIVMEDLDSNFKNKRAKIEKNVYQRFQTMLVEKLKLVVLKDDESTFRNPLQLAGVNSKANVKKTQDGIIFYVNPWKIRETDPKTGFVNFFNTRYESMIKSQVFWEAFDKIWYEDGEFRFEFDYANFIDKPIGKTRWTIGSHGERIRRWRSTTKKNTIEEERVDITKRFMEIFEDAGVEISGDLKDKMAHLDNAKAQEKLMNTFWLMLQMRCQGKNEEFVISPVVGDYYDTRKGEAGFPKEGDGNDAYNLARKLRISISRDDDQWQELGPKAVYGEEYLEAIQ